MEEKVVWHVSSANFGKEQLWKCAMFVKVPRVWRVDEDNSSLSTQAHKYTRTQVHKKILKWAYITVITLVISLTEVNLKLFGPGGNTKLNLSLSGISGSRVQTFKCFM